MTQVRLPGWGEMVPVLAGLGRREWIWHWFLLQLGRAGGEKTWNNKDSTDMV
jgi:hypothetical protein